MCKAHSCACGGRLRHLHCTPQCASLAERFYILGKHFPNFKNASAFLLRDARHAMHDILLLRISAILPEAISDGGLTPTTDTDLLLATYRGGSHLTSDIKSPVSLLSKKYRTFMCFTLFYCSRSEPSYQSNNDHYDQQWYQNRCQKTYNSADNCYHQYNNHHNK